MESTVARCSEIEGIYETKLDSEEFHKGLRTKLDIEAFIKVFPTNKTPQETLNTMIQKQTESFNERVLNMVKLWDQKIATLRTELNIKAIYRKLTKFTEHETYKKGIEELKEADKAIQANIAQILFHF